MEERLSRELVQPLLDELNTFTYIIPEEEIDDSHTDINFLDEYIMENCDRINDIPYDSSCYVAALAIIRYWCVNKPEKKVNNLLARLIAELICMLDVPEYRNEQTPLFSLMIKLKKLGRKNEQ